MSGTGILRFSGGRTGRAKTRSPETFEQQRRRDVIRQDVETMRRVIEIDVQARRLKAAFIGECVGKLVRRVGSSPRDGVS